MSESTPVKKIEPCPVDVNKQADQCIRDELCQSQYVAFVNIFDQVYYRSFIDHFGSWYDPSAPLVSDVKIEALVCLFEKSFPYTSCSLHTASNSMRSLKTINTTFYMKKFITYQHFLSMCRLRNKNKLTWWAMVEGLPQVARGLTKAATTHNVISWYSLSYPTIFRRLNQFAPALRDSNRKLLQSQVSLDCRFDNFQVFMCTKFQRAGLLANSMHATCRLAKRYVSVLPTVVSLLVHGLRNNAQYYVVSIVHHTTYASLLMAQCRLQGTRNSLPWPATTL